MPRRSDTPTASEQPAGRIAGGSRELARYIASVAAHKVERHGRLEGGPWLLVWWAGQHPGNMQRHAIAHEHRVRDLDMKGECQNGGTPSNRRMQVVLAWLFACCRGLHNATKPNPIHHQFSHFPCGGAAHSIPERDVTHSTRQCNARRVPVRRQPAIQRLAPVVPLS